MKTKQITIDGTQYWLIGDRTDGAVAPLDHCDAEGNVTLESVFEQSFGHCFDGTVMRFGNVIGHLSDDLTFTPVKVH